MRQIAGILGVALAFGSLGTLAAGSLPGGAGSFVTAAGQSTFASTISKDDSDNEDGSDPGEGTGVVDPVPQDDGTPGVDDGTGDDAP